MPIEKRSKVATHAFPWLSGHACHEYRAMGLELELIELVRCRDVAASAGEPVVRLDEQIHAVLTDLAAEATATVAA